MNDDTFPSHTSYDVVVIGGALSGSATAVLLLRKNPGLRVLIVEKSETLGRRVGEATVEVSAYFLGHVLGLTQYLNEAHISKQGLRFWFTNKDVQSLDQASEIGPRYLARLPSYQIDRSKLDEEVLRRVTENGAEVWRPATVSKLMLNAGGMQELEVKHQGQKISVEARWVVDASGLASVISRQQGWLKSNDAHPTASAWARWSRVKDWDGRELAQKFPQWADRLHGTRGTATNHIIGDGWWSWWIPLKGGDMSVGVVFDQRIVDFPKDGGSVAERLKAFLMQHPVAREILEDAAPVERDVHWRKNLAYYSTTFAGNGFALVGDAAAFMDPFYSPGMDWISYTSSYAAHLITKQRKGEMTPACVEKHNRDLAISHSRWFNALYKDKYEYLGEYDLLNLAFKLDLSLYYWGLVHPVFELGDEAFLEAPFSPPSGRIFAALMRTYNRRFVKIARRRRRLGLLGKMNAGQLTLLNGFLLERSDCLRIFGMLKSWAKLELKEGWKSWGREPEERMTESSAPPAQASGRGNVVAISE